MNNIFKGAKFGDKFLTRSGKVAIFDKFYKTSNEYHLYIEDGYSGFYSKHGDYIDEEYPDEKYDIISRYQEKIDVEKLETEAWDYIDSTFDQKGIFNSHHLMLAFKAGYRTAMGGE